MKRVLIIGAGPGGICTGIKLKEAGHDDFVIVEQADGVGGTWRHNAYPGFRCDVPSVLYSFSFAMKPDWQSRYATQPEILAYLEQLAEQHGLTPHLRLNTRVTGAEWDEAKSLWRVTLGNGDALEAEVLVSAVGLFNEPNIPAIPGLDSFAGPVMHSARWRHDVALEGRRIAVIGSAASAVQLVPEVAQVAGELTVYQRTPNHVRAREEDYTPEEQAAVSADPALLQSERARVAEWVDAMCKMQDTALLDYAAAECVQNASVVEDEDTRRRLSPGYAFGGKRPLVSSDWFPAFNRPNVRLVTDPIARVEADAVVTADGIRHPADVLILATGFQTTRFLSAIPVRGRGGQRLEDAWAHGARAYLGITVSGFPNLFMLYGPNTNNGSILANIECQAAYFLRHLERMEREELAWIDVRPETLDAYNAMLQREIAAIPAWNAGVAGYYRAEGGLNVTQWPDGMQRYRDLTGTPDDQVYDSAPLPVLKEA